MHISVFKFVSVAKHQQFEKKTGDGLAKLTALRAHIT